MINSLSVLLHQLPKIGSKRVRQIYRQLGEFPQGGLFARPKLNENELHTILAELFNNTAALYDLLKEIPESAFQNLTKTDIEQAKDKTLEIQRLCEKENIQILQYPYDKHLLPQSYWDLEKTPLALYYRGDISLLRQPAVAVVGTRKPSAFGLKAARRFGEVLAENNIVVVSGLALGCDAAAHQGCLNKNGKTIAVLAEGLDKISPFQNRGLAEKILERGGCLISEYPPKYRANKISFVARDYLESAFSQRLIVAEATLGGGTMHTAESAKEQKKPIGVLKPQAGNKTAEQAKGSLFLLEQGAHPIFDPKSLYDFIKI